MSGCGEFSYKRGATAQDLVKAKKTCESLAQDTSGNNQAQLEACMQQQGWTVQHLDDDKLFATASYNPSNPNQVAAPANSENDNQTPPDRSLATDAKAKNNETAAVAPNPLDTYAINSWWKIGSSAVEMQAAIDSCVATLGDAHQPNVQTGQVTRGLVVCMREKGWWALRSR